MKRKTLLSLLSAFCLGCLSLSAQSYENATLETIHSRASVREYSTKAVSRKNLVELVKAGMAAPTGSNKQPWEFIIIQDPATLAKIGTVKPPVGKAQAAIVVLGDSSISGSWVLDCSAATQNILLAATSLELGAVWTGAYGNQNFENLLRETLLFPEDLHPLSVIAVGYPSSEPKPKDKYVESKVHFEVY